MVIVYYRIYTLHIIGFSEIVLVLLHDVHARLVHRIRTEADVRVAACTVERVVLHLDTRQYHG